MFYRHLMPIVYDSGIWWNMFLTHRMGKETSATTSSSSGRAMPLGSLTGGCLPTTEVVELKLSSRNGCKNMLFALYLRKQKRWQSPRSFRWWVWLLMQNSSNDLTLRKFTTNFKEIWLLSRCTYFRPLQWLKVSNNTLSTGKKGQRWYVYYQAVKIYLISVTLNRSSHLRPCFALENTVIQTTSLRGWLDCIYMLLEPNDSVLQFFQLLVYPRATQT